MKYRMNHNKEKLHIEYCNSTVTKETFGWHASVLAILNSFAHSNFSVGLRVLTTVHLLETQPLSVVILKCKVTQGGIVAAEAVPVVDLVEGRVQGDEEDDGRRTIINSYTKLDSIPNPCTRCIRSKMTWVLQYGCEHVGRTSDYRNQHFTCSDYSIVSFLGSIILPRLSS